MALSLPPPQAPLPRQRYGNKYEFPEPNVEVIKQRLLRKGVSATPKILHALRKKEIQKSLRRANKHPVRPDAPTEEEDDDVLFRVAQTEYRAFEAEIGLMKGRPGALHGKPWENSKRTIDLGNLGGYGGSLNGGRLQEEPLQELRQMFEDRNGEEFRWLLDDDLEERGENASSKRKRKEKAFFYKQVVGDDEKIKWLVERLTCTKLNPEDWKFSKLIMKSDLHFSESCLFRIIDALGAVGNWRHAMAVVKWVYQRSNYKYKKSRFVYTKLLDVLGKSMRPIEALSVFKLMREDGQIYPDTATYHVIAVTLGQCGLLKELINVIECMGQEPSRSIKNMKHRDCNPSLKPDIIVLNSVLNACIASRQWKGVYWVFDQLRIHGMKPIGATYGLAMEVMLKSGKYDLVHKYFEDMQQSGAALKALTYKILVRAYWEENKVDEAVRAVRDMEQKGVVGTASVYYELACCLCNHGRWEDAILEVENLKRLPLSKPLVVTFTGMILFSLHGGHIDQCISIFEQMKGHCAPNIGAINVMLKIYGRHDMFARAKALFESINGLNNFSESTNVAPINRDAYSYSSMLEASALAQQWEYFEHVYREMTLHNFLPDTEKYAWLFIEASRAGKWHVLDHAFNVILEEGNIPHVSLFTEMVCQTICNQDFSRIAGLINCMAHSSIQFSQNQWADLFNWNKDRFDEDALLSLLGHLKGTKLVMEKPVTDLLNILLLLEKSRSQLRLLPPNCPRDVSAGYVRDSKLTFYEDHRIGETSTPDKFVEDADEGLSTFPDCEDKRISIAEAEIDALSFDEDFPGCVFLPNASVILEAWREERFKSGSFL